MYKFLDVPAIAIDAARLETLHLGRLVHDLLSAAIPAVTTGSPVEIDKLRADTRDRARAVIRGAVPGVAPALAISVWSAGSPWFEAYAGWVDPDVETTAVGFRTLFDLGSLSKVFTATAFLRLANDFKVDVDDRLNLSQNFQLTQEEIDALEAKVETAIETATDFALTSPTPPVEELEMYLFAPVKWMVGETEALTAPVAVTVNCCR